MQRRRKERKEKAAETGADEAFPSQAKRELSESRIMRNRDKEKLMNIDI